MADDYYNTLNVDRQASPDEIQKSYRKLARKYHPDLHADKSDKEKDRAKLQFQKVQQAYDVLSDPEKRRMYDQLGPDFERMGGGQNPFGGGNPFGAGGPQVDFSQIFGQGGPGGRPGGGGFEDLLKQFGMAGAPGGGRRGPQKGSDQEQSITVPFATAVLGGEHQLSLQRKSGKVEKIGVKIPAGIEHGKKIRLRGQGGSGIEGGPRGDLLVVVNIAPHPNYSRSGLNLNVTLPISLVEAISGAKIDLPTPHGVISVTVPAGTSSGKSLRLKGMGIQTDKRKGDLIANLQIVLPTDLSDEDVEALRQIAERSDSTPVREKLTW